MIKLKVLIIIVGLTFCGSSVFGIACGDSDNNASVDIADLVFLVNYMFHDGPPLPYPPAVDCNGDGKIDIADLVCWVDHWFMGGPPPSCPFSPIDNHSEVSGGCLGDPIGDGKTDHLTFSTDDKTSGGYLYLEVVGDELRIHHLEAYYQCCLGYYVDHNLSGYEITAFESDTGMLCDCYCYFNLLSTVYDLAPGEYTVILIGIEGDTLGVDSAVIGGDGPALIGYTDSGCLEEEPPGEPADVNYWLSGDTLMMEHLNAFFNCGAEIVVDFALIGDTLRFYERNISHDYQYCLCYFEVYAFVEGILPGVYIAEIYMQEYPESTEPFPLVDRRVVTLGE